MPFYWSREKDNQMSVYETKYLLVGIGRQTCILLAYLFQLKPIRDTTLDTQFVQLICNFSNINIDRNLFNGTYQSNLLNDNYFVFQNRTVTLEKRST